jgi:hypothetical protein
VSGTEELYNHLYAIWSADDMDKGEFEYRCRQVQALSHRQTEQAVQALLDRTQHFKIKVNPTEYRDVEALPRELLEAELERLRRQTDAK